MKKILLLVVIVLNIQVVGAKQLEKSVYIGNDCQIIQKIFGNPDIKTEDSEGDLTWIYNSQIPENDLIDATKVNNSVFVVKFDKNNCVKSYSYKLDIDMEK